MRGYFDGDGCWTVRKSGQLRFNVVGTKPFVSFYQKRLISQAGVSNVTIGKSGKIATLDYGGKYTKNIYRFLYHDATIWLDRKRAIASRVLGIRY